MDKERAKCKNCEYSEQYTKDTFFCAYPQERIKLPEGYVIANRMIGFWMAMDCNFYKEKNKTIQDVRDKNTNSVILDMLNHFCKHHDIKSGKDLLKKHRAVGESVLLMADLIDGFMNINKKES